MIELDGSHLTLGDVVAIALRHATGHLTDAARERITASTEFGAKVAAERPIYGRTTGVGANRTVPLADPSAQALALLRSHATTGGPPRSPERVRAMLAVRLNQLAAGGSGVSVAVADALDGMLEKDAIPVVHELGSIGTGDLGALATIALALAGITSTKPPVPAPARIGIGDALAFISSNAGALGDTALALSRLADLAHSALTVAALTHVAVDGNPEAYSPAAERATPFPGAATVCGLLRGYLAGDDAAAPARIQDPFGLRALPQVHGALLDRLGDLETVLTRMINAPMENPLLLPGLPVAHHGSFHAVYLAQALDAARSALAQAAQLGLARLVMLDEPSLTGQAPFLSDQTAGTSGTMMMEYVAASALATVRAAGAPVAVQTVTLSRGVEEDASFASLAATQTLDAIAAYQTLTACELVAAVRCLRMRNVAIPNGLQVAWGSCGNLTEDIHDRDLTEDISTAEALLPRLAYL